MKQLQQACLASEAVISSSKLFTYTDTVLNIINLILNHLYILSLDLLNVGATMEKISEKISWDGLMAELLRQWLKQVGDAF